MWYRQTTTFQGDVWNSVSLLGQASFSMGNRTLRQMLRVPVGRLSWRVPKLNPVMFSLHAFSPMLTSNNWREHRKAQHLKKTFSLSLQRGQTVGLFLKEIKIRMIKFWPYNCIPAHTSPTPLLYILNNLQLVLINHIDLWGPQKVWNKHTEINHLVASAATICKLLCARSCQGRIDIACQPIY